ncbi:MAG TPA: pyridoxal-dependent decarboxylase, partial [Mizugakiibacter sp.]
PYGAGAFVCRDHRAMALLAEDADYVFERGEAADYRATFRALGRYTLECAKSGAAAAAAYVAHRVLPLDREHFGRIPRETVQEAERFYDRLAVFATALADVATVRVPFEPDSNLVCVAINPRGNRSLRAMNRFVGRLYDALRVDAQQPLQTKAFFGSITTLRPEALGPADTARVLAELELDPATLAEAPREEAGEDDRIVILRHTLMNPFLHDTENGIDYPELYLAHLETLVRGLLAAQPAAAVA